MHIFSASTVAGLAFQRTPDGGLLAKRMRVRMPGFVEIHVGNVVRRAEGSANTALKAIAEAVHA